MQRFNPLYALLGVALIAAGGLVLFLVRSGQRNGTAAKGEIFVYCAAGMRYPMEKIKEDYEKEFGVQVNLQYNGSNTLLSQLETAGVGDLYLAGDNSYIETAQEKGLADEHLPLALMRPVIAVSKDNDSIQSVKDLASSEVRVGIGNPEAAAIGKKTKKLLTKSGDWEALEANVTANGVFKPTVNEVAIDVKLGSVDAGVIWDSTVAQYPELKAVRTPELDAGEAHIGICVLKSSKNASAALHFARYVAARDRGLATFKEFGFRIIEGDKWSDRPVLTFYAGSVNRRAIEDAIAAFADREGVDVNTVYNGCGILTADMRSIRDGQTGAFPDAYMACDVYYLETVQEMFQPGKQISSADIVIVVAKGNPQNIQSVQDLIRPGVKVAIGQPKQCTIGVLSRRLLEAEGVYDQLLANNVVTQTATSALLVPTVSTGSADAALAYITDTLSESERVETIAIDSPSARAIQPFSVSLSSDHKQLADRLFRTIAAAKAEFQTAGFEWILNENAAPTIDDAPTGEGGTGAAVNDDSPQDTSETPG